MRSPPVAQRQSGPLIRARPQVRILPGGPFKGDRSMNCKSCLHRFNCYTHLDDNEICEKYEQAQNQEREVENTDENQG